MDGNFDLVISAAPAIWRYASSTRIVSCRVRRLPAPSGRIVAAARQKMDDAGFRQRVSEGAQPVRPGRSRGGTCWHAHAVPWNGVSYFALDVNAPDQYRQLKARLDERASQTVFYLSVGPSLFPAIIDGLKLSGLNVRGKDRAGKAAGTRSGHIASD